MRILAIILFLFIAKAELFPQQYMLVQKPGHRREFIYAPGEQVQLCANGVVYQGIIRALDSKFLYLGNTAPIPIDSITYIERARLLSSLAYATGSSVFLVYPAISGLNRTINKEYPVIDKPTFFVMGGAGALALSGYLFRKRKLEYIRGWTITVLDFQADDQ